MPIAFALMWQIRKLYGAAYRLIAARHPTGLIAGYQVILVDIASILMANALYAVGYFGFAHVVGPAR